MGLANGRPDDLYKKIAVCRSREISIPTPRGHNLVSHWYETERELGKTMVISSATGVLQGFYRRFSEHFAGRGYTVFTFDYSGIGKSGSLVKSLRGNLNDLKSWGSNDQAAVLTYARANRPKDELILLTHSVGGQLLGFNPQFNLLDKIVMIASQSGYWKLFKGLNRYRMWAFWYILIPGLTPLFGYFPAKLLRLFENIPPAMAYEWMRWGRKESYMMAFHEPDSYYFDRIEVPLLTLSFEEDMYAPRAAVDWLSAQYSRAELERIHFSPGPGERQVGHFGFFREAFSSSLWESTDQWLRGGRFQTGGGV